MVNMDSLLNFVKPYYEDKDIMHDLSHINRVLRNLLLTRSEDNLFSTTRVCKEFY